MLGQICQYLRNWFDLDSRHERLPFWTGRITISGGALIGFEDKLLNGQYFRIVDSLLNDGIYQYPADGLADEAFEGTVQSMKVPPEIIALDGEIEAWIEANQTALNSPYQSESFGGYSYSLKSGGTADGGSGGVTWQSQFAARLSPWRKI